MRAMRKLLRQLMNAPAFEQSTALSVNTRHTTDFLYGKANCSLIKRRDMMTVLLVASSNTRTSICSVLHTPFKCCCLRYTTDVTAKCNVTYESTAADRLSNLKLGMGVIIKAEKEWCGIRRP